jgi:starvation-inducible DNA-binding protein
MTTQTTKTFSTHNDLSSATRQKMIGLLNEQLAATFDLFSQTKQAHWNVKGPQFMQLHELFDELAAGLLGYVDMIAERATALGGVALGTTRLAAKNSHLDELPGDVFDGMAVVEALVKRYATLAQSTRKAIDTADASGDMDTADMLTEVSRGLDKSLWFLEAHIQG